MRGGSRSELGRREKRGDHWVDRAGGKPGFLDNMADRPIRSAGWRTVEIEGDVAPDAELLSLSRSASNSRQNAFSASLRGRSR